MANFGLKLLSASSSTFILDDSSNGIVVQSFNEPFTSRVAPINVPRMAGALMDTDIKLSPKVISIGGLIKGTSKDDYRTKKDAFKVAIELGRQKLYYFDDRYIYVQKSDCPIRDHITGLYGEFALDLLAVDPFWYSNDLYVSSFSDNTTSYNFSVSCTGNAPTPPTILITTTATGFTNPSVANTSYSPSKSILHTGVGSSWTVTCSDFTAMMDSSDSISLFSGTFWELLPGSNSLTFTQSSGVSVSIAVAFTNRWL